MTQDYHDYFLNRIAQPVDTSIPSLLEPDSKATEVQRASDAKTAELKLHLVTQRKQEELRRNSVVGKLGLEPNGVAGTLVNFGAALVEGAVNVEKNIATSIHGFHAAALERGIPQAAKDAYARKLKGEHTPQDGMILGLMAGDTLEPKYPDLYRKQQVLNARGLRGEIPDTNLNRIERYHASLQRAKDVREGMDVSSIVNKQNQAVLEADFRDGFSTNFPDITDGAKKISEGEVFAGSKNVVSGIAGLFKTIGSAALNNKTAALELITTNAPQLILAAGGAAGMALTNVPYALDAFTQGLEEHSKKNGGALPTAHEIDMMALKAASLAVAETVGDKLMLGGKLASKAVPDAVKAGVGTALKSVPAAIKDNIVGRTAGATGKGAAGEFVTEAYQTAVEEDIKGNTASLEDIFVGGATGAIVGGGLSLGTHGIKEVASASSKLGKAVEASQTRSEAQAAAIATGDVTALADPKSSLYAPEKAIAALHKHSELSAATPEAKQASLEKAGAIVAELETERTRVQEMYATVSPEKVASYMEQLGKAKAEGKAQDAKDLEDLLKFSTPERVKGYEQQLTKLDRRLELARKSMSVFHQESQPKDVNLGAEAQAINAPVDATDTEASAARVKSVDTVINLSMAAPDGLDTAVATSLAENQDNGLTPAQRTYFREFSAARLADNKLKSLEGVSQDIFYGGKGYVGLVNYRDRVAQALATGNKAQADFHLVSLNKFADDHAAKAVAAAEAWARGPGNQIMKVDGGSWEVLTSRRPYAVVSKNGGLTLHGKSGHLVPVLQAEAAAVTQTAKELSAAYAVKFASPTKITPVAPTGANDVKVVPKAPAVSEAPRIPEQAPQAAGSAGAPKAAGRVPAAGTRSAEVAAPGVVAESQSTQPAETTSVESQASSDAEGTKGKPQSTNSSTEVLTVKDQGESVEPTPAEDQQSVADGTKEAIASAGTLTALGLKSVEGTPYNLQQLIAAGFIQNAGREEDTTQRPLVAVKDFFSALANKTSTAAEFLADKTLSDPTSKSGGAIRSFIVHYREWEGRIRLNLPKVREAKFKYQDMMQFLTVEGPDGSPDLDQNVKIAIAFAVTSWVADAASAPRRLTPKAINAILGRSKDARVSHAANNALSLAGSYEQNVVDALSTKVFDVLGLKAKSGIGQDVEARLRVALGQHALKLAEDMGLVKRTTLSGSKIKELRQEDMTEWELSKQAPVNTNIPHHFFAVARDKEGLLVAAVSRISTATKGTKDVLGKLFGANPSVKFPSLEPVTTVQATTAGTKMGVPAEQAEVVLSKQARPRMVRKDTLNLFSLFDQSELHAMMGVVNEAEDHVHAVNLPGVQAKNDGLKREWELFQEFVGEHLKDMDTPFFPTFSVWKQQRVGEGETAANPQTSKIARFLITSPSWKTTIDPADEKQLDSFYLRVGEGLGVKTERADNDVSIEKIKLMIKEPLIVAAVAALRKGNIKGEALSSEEKASILEAVAFGKANLHTLDVLVGLAYQAEAAGKSFTVQMMGEVDGVANGTMFNHVMMGAGETAEKLQAFLNKGGFFEEGSEFTQYNQWRGTLGNFDVYETTGKKIHNAVAAAYPKGSKQAHVLSSIWAIAGDIFNEETSTVTSDGRNLVKNALNPLGFGSSMEAVVRGLSDAFLDSVYKGFETLSAKGKPQAAVDAYVVNINTLISNQKHHLPLGKSIAWHMSQPLSKDAEAALRHSFATTVGKEASSVLEVEFAPFLAARDSMNKTAGLAHGLYKAVYDGERAAFIEELLAKKQLPVDDNGKRIGDLNKKQETELEKRVHAIMPVLQTTLSKEDKDRDTGLLLAKTKRGQSKDPLYGNGTQFSTQIGKLERYSRTQKTMIPQTSVEVSGIVSLSDSIGVGAGSAATHSADSGAMIRTQKKRDVLGIHDAVGDGINGLEESARTINGAAWTTLLTYSPLEEVYQSLASVMHGLGQMHKDRKLSPQSVRNLQQFMWEQANRDKVSASQWLEGALVIAKFNAYQADKMKFSVMKSWSSVDQYAYQGGNYLVTPEDRDDAVAREGKLTKELSKQDLDALNWLEGMLGNSPVVITTPVAAASEKLDLFVDPLTETTDEDASPPWDVAAPTTKTSPFGVLGTSPVKSDPDLVAFFKKSPQAKAADVLRHLYSRLNGVPGRGNEFSLQLVRVLAKTVPAGLAVRYVTASSLESDVLEKPDQASHAWFVSKDSKSEINILSPEFKDSGLTVEALLHELTHGALANTVARELAAEKASPKYRSEALELIGELDELREKAAAYAKKQGITKFGAALKDVQELITWGMTNEEFQRTVLSQITMPSKTQGNSLVNGMKAFVTKLIGLLFKGSTKTEQQISVNGMTVLISNVSGLFKARGDSKRAAEEPVRAVQRIKLTKEQATKISALKGQVPAYAELADEDIQYAIDQLQANSEIKGIVFRADKRSGLTSKTTLDDYTLVREGGAFFSTEVSYANNYNEVLKGTVYPALLTTTSPISLDKQEVQYFGRNKDAFKKIHPERDAAVYVEDKHDISDKYGNVGHEVVVYEPSQIRLMSAPDTVEKIKEIIAGKGGTIILSMAANPMGTVQAFNTLDIMNALNAGAITPTFDGKLRAVLGGIVHKLHGPFGTFKEALMKDQAGTPLDVWLKAINTGVAPFASSVQASPLVVSEQEAFVIDQVEATMREVLSRNEVTTKTVYKELAKLYTEMRATIKPTDFANQDAYEFIFGVQLDANGQSNHLARFAAFGMAHQEFNALIQRNTLTKPQRTPKGFAERLQVIWENVLEWFVGGLTKTYAGQQADTKLTALVGQLVDIEAKTKVRVALKIKATDPMAIFEKKIKGAGEVIRSQIGKAADSKFVRNNSSVFVQAAGALAATYVNDNVEFMMKGISDMRDENIKGKHGFAMQMLNDVRGPGKVMNLLALASTNMQRLRKNTIDYTAKNVVKAFANGGADLKKPTKDAITRVFLRTGAHHLLGTYSMAELENLLGNHQALTAAIGTLEAQLVGFGSAKAHFIHQANALGYFKVTGRVKHEQLMMNAHNIARLHGTPYAGRLTEAQSKQAESVIEKLVALRGLSYADSTSISAAKEVLRSENARTDNKGNGVEFALAFHKKLEQESLARLFRGQEALAMHGHTSEIINPHIDVKTANLEEGAKLVLQGYTKGAQVERDPADPDTEVKHIYSLKGAGLTPHLTGVIGYDGKSAKGSKKHNGYMNVNTADGMNNAAMHADIMAKKPTALDSGPPPDLSKAKHTFMAPIVNPSGQIVNWRYMMQDSTKDGVLERDNSFENVLGSHAGSIMGKESTTEINTKALITAKEIWEDQKGTNQESFILIGPKSPDPEMRAIWSMLPDDTKAVAQKIWGTDGMRIRKDQLTLLFGYRKYSLAEMFRKDPEARSHLEKMFVGLMEHLLIVQARYKDPTISVESAKEYAKRAAVIVTKGEGMWQELVHETKDILVVKTGITAMGNIWSNLSLLAFSGVPLKDMVRHHLVAFRGYRAYQADNEKIFELQALLDTGLTRGEEARIRRDLAVHKDSLSRNPVAKLIDAGLMPTIVEDVAQDDAYSYKSEFVRATEGFVAKLNPALVNVAKQVYMTHDTKLYQGLSRIAQLSDFVARYTLYEHVTQRKENPLSHMDAVHEASETFINYDTPMPKGMQYMDDTGITMFTKYFMRIQRVLLKLTKDNPARVLMGLVMGHFIDLGPIVLDGSWMNKIGNSPFGPGALQYLSSLDEIATVNSALSVFKTGSEWAP